MAVSERSTVFSATGFVGLLAVLFGVQVSTGARAPARPESPAPVRSRASRAAACCSTPIGAADLVRRYRDGLRSALEPYAHRHVLLATVPDPLDSRGDWSFDSYLEAIRSAFERSRYLPDRFWLPWDLDRGDSSRAMRHDSVPGILVFRGAGTSDTAWVVLLVGEVPTLGIHKVAFRWALDSLDVGALSCSSSLLIVGPSYSGSSRSLRDALAFEAQRSAARCGRSRDVRIVSGSATDTGNAGLLNAPQRHWSFGATVHPDAELTEVRRQVIDVSRLHGRVAVLTEGSTAYGEGVFASGEGFFEADTSVALRAPSPQRVADSAPRGDLDAAELNIRVPLGLATLRTEYTSQGSGTPDVAGRRAPFEISLRDPEGISELPAAQSRLTAPAAVEQLDAISEKLLHERVRAVGILLTDVRDQLFLARQVRQGINRVTIFTHSSDNLFLWPDFAEAMAGMIVITSYPLIPGAERWLGPDTDSSEVEAFPSEGAEGVFNATLILLGNEGMVEDYVTQDTRPERFAPSETARRLPAIWVTAVARDGFVPLGVRRGVIDSSHSYVVPARLLPPRAVSRPRPWYRPTLAWGTAVLLGVLTVILMLGPTRDRRRSALEKAAQPTEAARRVVRSSLLAHWDLYAGLRGFALIGVAATAEVAIWAWDPSANLRAPLAIVTVPAVLIILRHAARLVRTTLGEAAGALRFMRNGEHMQWTWVGELAFRTCITLAGVFFAVLLLILLASLDGLRGAERMMFAYRAIHPRSGLSPLAPVGLGSLGLLFWCSWHLQRITHLMATSPLEAWALEARGYDVMSLPQAPPQGESRAEGLERTLAAVRVRLFLLAQRGWSALLLLGLILVGLVVGLSVSTIVEHYAFRDHPTIVWCMEWLYPFVAVASLVCVVWGAYRLASIWTALRELLERVSASPLLSAFERLPGRLGPMARVTLLGVGTPADVDEVLRTQWAEIRRLFEVAKKRMELVLYGARPDLQARVAALHAREDAFALRAPLAVLETTQAPGSFDTAFEALEQAWAGEPSEDDANAVLKTLAELKPEDRQPSTADAIRRAAPGAERLWLHALEEHVGLHIARYAEWTIELMRRLSAFMVFTLISSTLLVAAHPAYDVPLVQYAFFAALVASVAVMVYVLFAMSRNTVLSRINGTDPGRVTWNGRFVFNIVTLVAVPAVAILSAFFPSVAGVLTAWIQPLVHALAGG